MSIGRVFSVAEPTAVAEGAGLLAAFGTSVVIVACSSLGRIGPRKIAFSLFFFNQLLGFG